MNSVTDRIANLSPAKRALLELRLKESSAKDGAIPRRTNTGSAVLSFAQQRLWFLDQLEPNSALYNIPKAVRLTGLLNAEALEKSLAVVVERHEALRTTFVSVDGEPAQVIHTRRALELQTIDLSSLSDEDREIELQRFRQEHSQLPFSLTSDLMLRATLVRLGAEEHVLLLVMHHIASDGWSMGVLFRELSVLYEAFCDGKPSPLPELPIQYADFAVWQREHLRGRVLDSQLSFWKNQLAGIPPRLNLAPERPRRGVRNHGGGRQAFLLPKDLSEALQALSRRENVTLYMTLLAAFKALLYRYTGQDDLAIGSPIAGRTSSEIEGLIGFFVNSLVLRTRLSGELMFKELLGRVRKVTLDAFAHQDLPFEKLVEVLHPKRDADHRSLVQVAFAFQNMPREPLKLRGLTVTPVRIESVSAKLDLTLFMWETEDRLAGALNYSTDLFHPATISRMAEHFQSLLEIVVADPERPLQKLPPFWHEAPFSPCSKSSREPALDHYASSNLTQNQLLIWAGQKLAPGVPVYNAPYTFTVHGQVNPDQLQKAFATLVNSSDALRTVIREIDGVPQQFVRTDLYYQLEYLDLSKHSDARSALEGWLETRCRLSFDFADRLFDSALIKLEEKRFVWYLNVHHIISDGWSMAIIFRWVSELYRRSVAGMILQDKVELPCFSDYIRYEHEYRRSQRHQDAENYWKRKLAEKSEPISFYGKRPAKQAGRMRRVSRNLGIERSEKLKRLAGRAEIAALSENASIFNFFAAVLVIYLYRITGNRRHSIGAPVHNRRSKTFRDTLGLFMEVLPLRVTIGEHDTLFSLVNKIKVEALAVHRFSQTIGNSPQNKAYDVLLNFRVATFSTFHDMPVQTKGLPTADEHHSLALQIHDFDESGNFVIEFDFHSEVFDDAQSQFAVNHFLQILDAFLDDPGQSVDRPSLLTKEEKKRILSGFNQTETTFSEVPELLPRLFEAQAKKTSDNLAILCEDRSLTYAELNSQSNRLAHHLSSLGVGPDKIVALCLEASPDAIVGILGILKAGAAYLPLDPQYPPKRLAFMLEDAQASVLLTQKKLLDGYPELAELIAPKDDAEIGGQSEGISNAESARRVLYLDTDWRHIAGRSQENPVTPITPDNSAYVIYTSGSTGTAKAVVVPHRSVCNRLLWEQKTYPFTAADRALQKSSLAFDTSILEIFRPLLIGAVMIMARSKDRQDSRYLADLIGEKRVTVAEFVPSMLQLLLEEKAVENCTSLEHVFSGGEALSPELQNEFFSRSRAVLYNSYGPTEASIDVTHWKCVPEENQLIVPIGRPIGNSKIYILDRYLNPVPVGVAGELHIGGAGLARGYLNRPELTAEKFIPNPFSAEPGARLYKTGDLARYLLDGNIEFLGRLDHQVKIRGFRIELGEIQAVLRQHPNVQQAVVLAREDGDNDQCELQVSENGRSSPNSKIHPLKTEDKRLIAYIVPRHSMVTAHDELRDFLRQRLPDYMLPGGFIFLDALPLTSSGKVDLNALPAPDGMRPDLNQGFVAPRTRAEQTLAEIWSKLLGLTQVGIRDNFFDLGGHSLLAVRLFAEIERTFGKRPPLGSLFQQATIEHLARVVGENDLPSTSLVPVQPQGSKSPFFCVHEFFGDVFCYRNLARHLGKDQPFYALQPRGLNGVEEPLETVEAMAAGYIDNIRTIQPHGPYSLGGLCFGGVIAFEMAQQLRAKGEAVALVALLDSGIGLSVGRLEWWWRFLGNFPLDFPSWLTGCLQLTGSQWLDVMKIKSAANRGRLASFFHSSAGAFQQNGVPPSLRRLGEVLQLSERHHRIARAQYRALKRYKPQKYAGPLTLFRARMQPLFSSHDPHKGWLRVAAGGMEVRNIPANHLGMLQEPHVQVLARELKASLEREYRPETEPRSHLENKVLRITV